MHSTATKTTSSTRSPATASPLRGGALVVALLLTACVQSPQAAVTTHQGAAQVAMVSPQRVACAESASGRAALTAMERDLRSQGLALTAACHAASGGWVVQVRVIDGMKASQVVRGPLADGHDVDMGTPAGVELANAPLGVQGFSPDVEHNRQWLQALMARHQFDNLPDAWWHFARRGGEMPAAASTDMAVR